MASKHNDTIVDQFTRQAAPYANEASIRNEDVLNRIVRLTEADGSDSVLDVACGPGLLVCAFARVVKHATGIDLTPAMLEEAVKLERQRGLSNVTWAQGDAAKLPYGDGRFSIVSSRFAFHHFENPLPVLREMRRVCMPGGRVVIADSSPREDKADAFNAMERLRDPSHVRAMPLAEMHGLFSEAGLQPLGVETFRLAGELDALLARSFPRAGDADRIRRLFEASLADDSLDMATRLEDGKIVYGFPIAVILANIPA